MRIINQEYLGYDPKENVSWTKTTVQHDNGTTQVLYDWTAYVYDRNGVAVPFTASETNPPTADLRK